MAGTRRGGNNQAGFCERAGGLLVHGGQRVGLWSFLTVEAVHGFAGRSRYSRRRYIPELVGLRGIAIIIVVFGHLFQRVKIFDVTGIKVADAGFFDVFATPFSGCCIFFCVSGYTLMLYMRASGEATSILKLQIRRIIRIIPPYYFVLSSTYIFISITRYEPVGATHFFLRPDSLLVSLAASLALAHDLIFATFPRLFPPGWFIETQCQFYLIAPMVWRLYLRVDAGINRLVIGSMVLVLFYGGALATVALGPANLDNTIIAYAPYFWLGALLADCRPIIDGTAIGRHVRAYPQLGWVALAALVVLGPPLRDTALQLAARLICLTGIICTLFIDGSSFQRALVNRWMTRIGVASYSIYLVHLQMLQILTPYVMQLTNGIPLYYCILVCVVLEIAAIMVISLVFYWLIERPFVAITSAMSATREAVHDTVSPLLRVQPEPNAPIRHRS